MAEGQELLFHASIDHAISLQRYSNGVVRKILALLNRVDPDLFFQLQEALERLPPESFSVARLEALLASVRSLNASAYAQVSQSLGDELRTLTEYEVEFQGKLFETALPSVSFASVTPEQVYAAAISRPMQGKLLKELVAGIEAARMIRVRDAIRIGYVEGETVAQMTRRLRGTRAAGYSDGLLEIDRRGAEAVVRTSVSHISNFAAQKFYEANDDIVSQWMFCATMDSRVSLTCASLNGKRFPIGKGPMPPRHISCRSVSVPLLRGQDKVFGTRASVDYRGDRPKGAQVDANMTFSAWLRSQPVEVQDEVLGKTRGILFRANKIEVDKFTNNKGVVYDLAALRRRDEALFKRAGL